MTGDPFDPNLAHLGTNEVVPLTVSCVEAGMLVHLVGLLRVVRREAVDAAYCDIPTGVPGPPMVACVARGDAGWTLTLAPDAVSASTTTANRLYDELRAGRMTFWDIAEQYRRHELTREDMRAVIRRGLREAHGYYAEMLPIFGLRSSEYRRLVNFLYAHEMRADHRAFRARFGGDQ